MFCCIVIRFRRFGKNACGSEKTAQENSIYLGREKKKKENREKVLTKDERWDIVLLLPAVNKNEAEKKMKKVLTNVSV